MLASNNPGFLRALLCLEIISCGPPCDSFHCFECLYKSVELGLSVSDPTRQSTRQPPIGMQQQQPQVPPSLPSLGQQPVGTIPPMPPSGPAPPFTMPAQGTVCLICSRDLTEPPAPPSPMPGKLLSCNYPPIQCEAGCRGWFHLHCSGLTPEAFYLLKAEGPLVEWLCTPCATQAYPNIPYIRLRH